MLTIGQLAAYAGVTVRAVRHYHQIGLLPEPQRDGWILMAARWPDRVREYIPGKLAQLDDPQLVRLYRVLSGLFDSDAGDDDPRLVEAADIMAALIERAYAAGEIDLGEAEHDD